MTPLDSVAVEAFGVPGAESEALNFDRFTSLAVTSTLVAPAEASFEIGDGDGFDRFRRLVALGAQFRVLVNDRPRLTGRVEALSSSLSAGQSATQSFVVRTRLSDAVYSSATQVSRLKGASIKQFLLAVYDGLGVTERDFDFRGDVSRNLFTGRDSRGGRPPKPLEGITEDQAKVQPPESVFSAADRHLRRHGFLHWDGPDGRIVVAAPDDTQEPLAILRSFRGREGQANNVRTAERSQDVSGAATAVGVFGVGGGAGFPRSRISGLQINADLVQAGFRRPVVLIDEGVRSQALAQRRASRELALRNRSLERLVITVDGLAYRERGDAAVWAPDTVVDVTLETMGGALGAYLVEEVTMSRDPSTGDNTRLVLVQRGLWAL